MGAAHCDAEDIGIADRKASMVSVILAGSIGTIIEWYDFLIYGTAAALVFNRIFFPNFDPTTAALASLGTYAVGFLARPFGAALFGHFGDRIGRKTMLMITMMVMALGTFSIGLLPTYDQIGIWAPILLVSLRLIQGVGLGGEWGGASLIVLEHAPANRRGFSGQHHPDWVSAWTYYILRRLQACEQHAGRSFLRLGLAASFLG